MERFKRSGKLNKLKTTKARIVEADRLIKEYSAKLKTGWTPYVEDDQVIYADSLQYNGLVDRLAE